MIKFFIENYIKFKQLIRYLISGSIAATVDLSLLYIFTDLLGWWYLFSATLAFILSFFVSFFLQKFWTFRDNNREAIYQQMTLYFILALVNIALNTFLMYLLVDLFKIWYIFSQIIAAGLIACESFILYKFFIFSEKKEALDEIKDEDKSNFKKVRKVLIATGIYPPDIGGPATYAELLKKELIKLGCQVKVVSYSNQKYTKKNEEIFFITRKENIIIRYLKYFFKVWSLADWAEVIYTLDLVSAGLPATLVGNLRKKTVIFRTGGDFLWEKAYYNGWTSLPLSQYYQAKKKLREKILISFCQRLLKRINLIIFSTELQSGIYQEYYRVPREKIRLVANPIPEIIVNEIDERYKNNLIFAGRLIKLKNLERLIRVFSEIKSKNISLLIFGEGPEKNNLQSIIEGLGSGGRIKIMEKVEHDKLLVIIKSCKFFILPSISEISPNLALECLAMKKPVILTKETGLNKNIIENLITVDPLSETDIRDKIEFLLDEDNLRNYENKIGKMDINKRNWQDVAYDHLTIFNSIL